MNKNKSLLIYLFLISLMITFDQAVKRWVMLALANGHNHRVNEWLNFSFAANRGISWSFFNNQPQEGFWLLTGLIFLVIVGFSSYAVIQHLNRHKIYFESMVIGGALSNIIDRVNHGFVIDFIDFHIKSWHWATFNIADILIVLGVSGILIKTINKK